MLNWQRVRVTILLSSLCVAGLATGVAAQEPELIVEIEKQEIYEGESVLYRVTLNHTENPTAPTLDGFDAFQMTSLGEQSLDSRQITIINGRRSEVVRRGRQYNYRLTPLKSGVFTIPAPTATVDGKSLVGRAISLKVIPPDDQDAVVLEFTTNRTSVYPMQPFELALTIAVKDLPDELKDRDPLSVQPSPPALTAAWLDDDQIPDGIEPAESWREILEPLISRRGNGFQVNNIGSSSAFSLFQNDATGFHPKPEQTTRKDADGVDAGYWEYRFTRQLIPRRLGNYQFAPVTLKGTFADGIENGQLVGQRIYALAGGVDVTVKDVPLQGRPDSYIGAVGSFEVTSELAPMNAKVGDPMTLTVTLSGNGTLADARPPAITTLPGMENAFRTYDATEESQPNSRRFTYSLRPLSTNVTEFPAIPVSYFDVDAEQYVTNNTAPIPVTIREAETLSSSEIVSTPSNSAASAGTLEVSEGGVFANDSNLSSLRNEAVRPGRWVSVWVGMIVSWAFAALGIGHVKRLREDPTLLRRRSAASRARGSLEAAASQISSGDAPETCESLRRAVTGLIADFADVPESGLTPRDAADRLRTLGIEESLCAKTQELLNNCDAARYGAAKEDVSQLHQSAASLFDQLIAALKKATGPAASARKATTAVVLLFGLYLSGCSSAPDLETSRTFQDAEQAFARATSPDEFARVARQYDQIGSDGFASGAVLYNQGNAWIRAGATGRAIATYRQAQRYRPRDPYLMANLQNALASTGREVESASMSGLAGYVFFWQNWLSYPEKFTVTTFLLAVMLALALFVPMSAHPIRFHRASLVMGALFFISFASTVWDWHRFDNTTHGVVVSDQAIARKGNSQTYEAAFTDPLTEGTEFVVLESRNDWLHVRLGDVGTGWLPQVDVQVY